MSPRGMAGLLPGSRRTAWTEFRRASNGHRVVFIGTMHVGPGPGYYQRIDDLLGDYAADGAEIHYEAIKPPTQERVDAEITDAERDLLKRWRDVRRALAAFTHGLLGGAEQAPWTGWDGPGWHNHDMDVLDLLRHHGAAFVEQEITVMGALLARAEALGPRGQAAVGTVFRGLLGAAPVLQALTRHLPGTDVVLGMRDDLAVRAVLDAAPRTVVLVWGAGHWPGQAMRLRLMGYEPTHHTMIGTADGTVRR